MDSHRHQVAAIGATPAAIGAMVMISNASVLAALREVIGRERLEKEVDAAVVDYLVSVIRDSLPQSRGAADQGDEEDHAVEELLLAHGLARDEAHAAELFRQLAAALGTSTATSPSSSSSSSSQSQSNSGQLKMLERPVQLQALLPEEPKPVLVPREEVVLPPPKEEVDTVAEFLKGTKDEDPKVRRLYLRELCPCHVKRDVEIVWDRILEMTNDPDAAVRYQVMHNLCDGSPATREMDVIAALERMHNDEDKVIRRKVHNVLTHYRKTGKWNIL